MVNIVDEITTSYCWKLLNEQTMVDLKEISVNLSTVKQCGKI